MPQKPECYGTMFPDLSDLEHNSPCKGKTFTALTRSQGVGVQSRSVTVDYDQWDACQQCPVYRSCYDLCRALLWLRSAIEHV